MPFLFRILLKPTCLLASWPTEVWAPRTPETVQPSVPVIQVM